MEVSLAVVLLVMVFMILIMTTGVPVPFALGGTAILALILFWGQPGFLVISSGIWSTFIGDNMVSIPMFLLMASVLEKSGDRKSVV